MRHPWHGPCSCPARVESNFLSYERLGTKIPCTGLLPNGPRIVFVSIIVGCLSNSLVENLYGS